MERLARIALSLSLALGAAAHVESAAAAQDAPARRSASDAIAPRDVAPRGDDSRGSARRGDDRHEDARSRWRALPPEGRELLARRFEELRALPPERREALLARARAWERIERELVEDLAPEDRARMAEMAPDERALVLREMVADRIGERARALRDALTDEQRERFERGDAAARRRIVDEVRRRHERALPGRLVELGRELGLGPRELERLSGLAPAEQRARVFEYVRRRAERRVERHGLPHGLSREQWERMRALPPEAFARRYVRMRERFAPPAAAPGAERERLLARIRAATSHTPEERIELARMSPEERRRVLTERRRERLLEVLRSEGAPEEWLARLARAEPGRWVPIALEYARSRAGPESAR